MARVETNSRNLPRAATFLIGAALFLTSMPVAEVVSAFSTLQRNAASCHRQARQSAVLLSLSTDDRDASSSITRRDIDIDFDRRSLLNCMLVSTATAIIAGTAMTTPGNAFPFGLPSPSSSSEGQKPIMATDVTGAPIVVSEFLSKRDAGERSMVQGLKGDPTYLIVTAEGGGLEPFALNAECSHLGCIVPWDSFQKKFVCPCHGSQYDSRGAVIRGPAPGPLKLAKVRVEEDTGKVLLENWIDEDFRTGEKPWWM